MEKKKSKKSDTNVLKEIKKISERVYKDILKKKNPSVTSPLRSLTNIRYDSNDGYFELIGKMKTRNLTASTVKSFAQTLKMMGLSKDFTVEAVRFLVFILN